MQVARAGLVARLLLVAVVVSAFMFGLSELLARPGTPRPEVKASPPREPIERHVPIMDLPAFGSGSMEHLSVGTRLAPRRARPPSPSGQPSRFHELVIVQIPAGTSPFSEPALLSFLPDGSVLRRLPPVPVGRLALDGVPPGDWSPEQRGVFVSTLEQCLFRWGAKLSGIRLAQADEAALSPLLAWVRGPRAGTDIGRR